MEKYKAYYSSFDIQGRSEDEIFRDLCSDKDYKKLGDVTWKEAFINLFGTMMGKIPEPRSIAARIVNRGLTERGLPEIDCENIYFNMFNAIVVNEHRYNHELLQSYRVVDACLMNVFATEFEYDDQMKYFDRNGIFTVGKEGTYGQYPDVDPAGTTALWGPNEELFESIVMAEILRKYPIWEEFKNDYNAFWEEYGDRYAEMLADTFLANAVRQYKKKTLTDEGFLMIHNAYYGAEEEVQVTLLDIYGYASTDIICIEQKGLPTPHVILYIPGGNNPFIEFLNLGDLRQWLAWHLADTANMIAFRKHFSLKLRQDGTSFTGVDNVLKGIAVESSEWPADKYILYEPTHLAATNLFAQLRDKTKQRMLDDGDTQIKSNSEATRDYALSIIETLISQLAVIDMIVPEIGIPINIALSATVLGLSSDIVVNGDTYEERKYGVGELVSSSLFTAMNLVPAVLDSASILRNFARATEELPAFVTEEQFMANHFNLTEEQLAEIKIGDTPHVPSGENPQQMKVIRLSNENSQLAIIKKVGGNKYVRLDAFNLKEIDGSLITEVLDPETGSYHYFHNTGLIGGTPYNPFHAELEGVWTSVILERRASVVGKPIGQSYKNILEKLQAIHMSDDFDIRQSLMHELMELIDNYEVAHPTSGRLPAIRELRTQLENALYLPDSPQMVAVKAHILAFPNKGSGVTRFLFNTTMKEVSSQGEEITANLIRFAKNDNLIPATFKGYTGGIPTDIDFSVKFVVQDISIFDNLNTNYFELPTYQDLGITSNSELLNYILNESQNASLLKRCSIVDNSLYIGHTYEELYHSISGYANGGDKVYPVHPLTFFEMLQEAQSDNEFAQLFATRGYYNETVTGRLSLMENAILLSKDFDYTEFDANIAGSFRTEFENAEDTTARIALSLTGYQGLVIDNSVKSIDLFIDNLSDFIANGLTDIAVTDLQYDLAQPEIMRFLSEEGNWQQLDSMLLTLDKGDLSGPYRRLLKAAKENDLRFTALGHADHSVEPFKNQYRSVYFKGNTIMKSIEQLMDQDKKYIIFTNAKLINSSPGVDGPQPGLAQYLKVPGTVTDAEGNWEFYADLAENRIAINGEQLDNWENLAPEEGRIMGLKQFFVKGGIYPLPSTRRIILENSVPEELRDGLFQIVDQINNDVVIQSMTSAELGSCDTVATNILGRLEEMNIDTGSGASIAWWTKEDHPDLSYDHHTATSFRYNDIEYAVDGSHMQLPHDSMDDNVIILPIDAWADEIARRIRAINPFLVYRLKSGNALTFFEPPYFTKPRFKRPK